MGKDHPDADLFPEATGPAKQTVKAHSAPSPLQLYAGWFCPFVQRAWILLEEKSLQYQYTEVNPYHKPASLLSLNPRGLVPTLSHHGKPLYESSVICEFLEDAFPDHTPRLRKEDPYQRARERIWAGFVDQKIVPAFHRFLQCQDKEKEKGEAGLEAKRYEFLGLLKQFTKEMVQGRGEEEEEEEEEGPFFGGKEFGMVDVMLATWAVRLWVFDRFKEGGLGIPEEGEGGEDEGVWRRWRVWLEAVKKRKSVVETGSDREHYLPIYQRYAEDRAQSELAKATREGRGVP